MGRTNRFVSVHGRQSLSTRRSSPPPAAGTIHCEAAPAPGSPARWSGHGVAFLAAATASSIAWFIAYLSLFKVVGIHTEQASALEGLEARHPQLGQCRWRPEGRRHLEKSLKERLRYTNPDVALAVEFVAPSTAMDATTAVVHETVNKIISGFIDNYERKSSVEDHLERLEMAQIKLDFALETSNKWQITGGPLLRWQKKLKRAAEECDETLRKCRQRVQEEEEVEQQMEQISILRIWGKFSDGEWCHVDMPN
uniref:Rx N-terminal domain-containing protein n=1 Tax=Leersia perrieri TaxID=77586 RepID=A0A0D9WV17_9ORYZ